jgi:hypothetical protein
VRSLSLSLCHQFLNIWTYVRSSNSGAAFESFIVESISMFTLDHFHFWCELFTKHMWLWRGLSFTACGHQALKTYEQVEFIKVKESNVLKCISQVCITLQIYHLHLKFGWKPFNININWQWQCVGCGHVTAYILQTGDEFLLKKFTLFVYFLVSVGISFLRIGKCVTLFDHICSF